MTVHDLLVDMARSLVDSTGSTKRRFLRWVEKPDSQPPAHHATLEHLIIHPLTSSNLPLSLFRYNSKVVSLIANVSQDLRLPDLAPGLRCCRLLVIRTGRIVYWSSCGLKGLTNLQVLYLDSDLDILFREPRAGLHAFPSSLKSLSHVHPVDQRSLRSIDFTELDPQGLLEVVLDRCDSLSSLESGSLSKLQHVKISCCGLSSLSANLFNSSCALKHLEVEACHLGVC